ncbi:MAG: 4Fe-4S dicluster domain-containing protein [Nitrospiraceae bacterium]
MATDPAYGRRQFLRDSAWSVAKAAHEFAKHRDAPPEKPQMVSRTDWLRPPGAVDESSFLERCTRCGDCSKACPHGAVTFDQQNGSPVIFPDEVPCHLCDDFPCIAACATDALRPVLLAAEVNMGRAVVSHRLCTAGQGCHACVSKCPTDALAMDFDSMQLAVDKNRCVGCGMCEHVCKTVNDQIAIKVIRARPSAGDKAAAGL